MSRIDNLGTSNAGSAHASSAGAEVRQQSWLKALEDAGLREALADTRQFRSGRGNPPATQDPGQESREKNLVAKPPREANADRFAHQQPKNSQGTEASAQQLLLLPSAGRLDTLHDRGSVGVPAKLPDQKGGSGVVGDEACHDIESRLPMEMMLRRKWQPRKVTVLPYEQGVEVWVRDSALSKEDLKGLLGGLQKSAGELGASLVRAFLNGKPLNRSGALHAEKVITKEE